MTPLDVLAWLCGGGFSVEERGGRLWVSPASRLTEADRALIAEHREALLEYLRDPTPEEAPRRLKMYNPGPQLGLFGEDSLNWR